MMEYVDIWKAFIEAQDILLQAYSYPFFLKPDTVEKVRGNEYRAELDSDIIYKKASLHIHAAFPGIPLECIDWQKGLIRKPDTVQIDTEGIKKLKEEGSLYHLYFNDQPAISFEIKSQITRQDIFSALIGRVPEVAGEVLYLSQKEMDTILQTGQSNLELHPPFGAVFKVQPSAAYLQEQQQQLYHALSAYGTEIKQNPLNGNVTVYNTLLTAEMIEGIESSFPYKARGMDVAVKVAPNSALLNSANDAWRKYLGVYWQDEEYPQDFSLILPRPRGRVFTFALDAILSSDAFKDRLNNLRIIFNILVGPDNFEIQYRTRFRLQMGNWWSLVTSDLVRQGFQVNQYSSVISFDFSTTKCLEEKRDFLRGMEHLTAADNKENHLYKVRHSFHNALDAIQEALVRAIPGIDIHYAADEESLVCSHHYAPGADNEIEKVVAQQRISQVLKGFSFIGCEVIPPRIELGYDEYAFHFRLRDGLQELEQQLVKLKQEEFGIKGERWFDAVGIIKKVAFPFINFEATGELDLQKFSLPLYGNLKGEQEKVKRLSETVEKIYDDNKSSCVNDRVKEIIKDSAAAVGIEELEQLADFKVAMEEVNVSRLNKTLNPKQLEAVTKSLFAKDIFVIQGPPGTGKSTGISEIIWQHLKVDPKQKVLVTSETNLAVDNALDRLRSKHHNLIKPVRFGSEEKLDAEGKKFSYQYLHTWSQETDTPEEETADSGPDSEEEEGPEGMVSNIVEDWMSRIARYAGQTKMDAHEEYITQWQKLLTNPTRELKGVFFDNYVRNINVIGATCSSISKKSSTGTFTTFFQDYCTIYHPTPLSQFRQGRLTQNKGLIAAGAEAMEREEIKFDLVIQDEASKASPPEMALPIVYGQKSIIIGDHRQLPPMIDTNEFIKDITNVAERSRDRGVLNRAKKLVRYIKNNREEFSVSHFERMYKNIHPSLKAAFNLQYRMHPSINAAISQFYPERPHDNEYGLFCGLDESQVESPDLRNPQSRYHGIAIPGFLEKQHHIVWVNVNTPELIANTSRYNPGEISVIEKIVSLLCNSTGYQELVNHWPNREERELGIISFYGAQLHRLRRLQETFLEFPMRISTVDRFQGMERNVIIVSTVRSNRIAAYENQAFDTCEPQESLGFAEFPNRLNVALSRAKRLLIVVGNADHFSKQRIYSNLINVIKNSPNGLFIQAEDL